MQMASRYLVAVNKLNKDLWVANKQWSSSLVVEQAANTPYHKNIKVMKWNAQRPDHLNGYSKTMMIPV
jgi:hypothetical protein